MKHTVTKEIPLLLILLIPFIVIATLWHSFPDSIPIHWSMQSGADRFVSKMPGLLIVPSLNFFIYLLFLAIPRIDQRWKEFNLFKNTYYWLRFGIVVFMALVWAATILPMFYDNINIGVIIIDLVILLFLGLGITFLRIKPNHFIGIRLPWTLKDENNWRMTHQLSGKLWIISSIIMFILSFYIELPLLLYIFFAWILLIIVIPIVYSYNKSIAK